MIMDHAYLILKFGTKKAASERLKNFYKLRKQRGNLRYEDQWVHPDTMDFRDKPTRRVRDNESILATGFTDRLGNARPGRTGTRFIPYAADE